MQLSIFSKCNKYPISDYIKLYKYIKKFSINWKIRDIIRDNIIFNLINIRK